MHVLKRCSVGLWLLAAAAGARAHEAGALDGWRMEPWVALLLAASVLLYGRGVAALWRQAGVGRGIGKSHAAAFGAGWLVTLIALVPPIDPLGVQLFSMHMVQHELLMVVAAPLLVLGRPFVAWSWGWRGGARRVHRAFSRPWPAALWRRLTDPFTAWLLHGTALWLWHVPALFEAAIAHQAIHELQHISFFGTALLFWWSIIGHRPHAASQGVALVSLFTTMIHTGVLGALLTLTPRPWYPIYAQTTLALGLDPLADQHLGGLLMWVPGAVAYLVAALVVASQLLAEDAPVRSKGANL